MTLRRTTIKDLSLDSKGYRECCLCNISFPFGIVQPLSCETDELANVCPICALRKLREIHGVSFSFNTKANIRKHEAALLFLKSNSNKGQKNGLFNPDKEARERCA